MAQSNYKHLDDQDLKAKTDRGTRRLYAYATPYYKQFLFIFVLIIVSVL